MIEATSDRTAPAKTLRRLYVDTAVGQVHVVDSGAGPTVLCLHQTPRSWDEFREIIPLLATSYRVLAMDTPGMGNSPAPRGKASIENYALAAAGVLEALGIAEVALIGHHTGGVIAARLAASLGGRVWAMVLSSTPLVDAEARRAREHRPDIDGYVVSDDGSHLSAIWSRRAAFYPSNRPDLQARYTLDSLRARDPEEGHRAVARYRMEDDLDALVQPALVVRHAADPYASPEASKLAAALAQSTLVTIERGMVPLEFAASEFVALCEPFLRRYSPGLS
ncbi:MAG: alpha/beta fold hydrolase [Pseudomonadota bacterium]